MIAVGLLLLGAAGLKLFGQAVSPVPQTGAIATPTLQAALILWECLLGLWMIAGAARLEAWLMGCATFAIFWMASGHFGIIGQATCGCFGTVEASPWAAFAVDSVVLVFLALARPQFTSFHLILSTLQRMIGVAACAAAILGLFAVIGISQYGSVEIAMARIKDESLIAPVYVDFGDIAPDQEVKRTIHLTNASDQPLRIVGGTADCSCIVTKDLPIELAPNEQRSIVIALRAPNAEGMFTRKVFLLTGAGGLQRIPIRIGGRVR